MADIRILSSLREIARAEWNMCFPAEIEDYDYLYAAERSAMPGFKLCYITLRENGLLQAAMPAFFMDYALDTTLGSAGKKIATSVKTIFPNALTLKLACLGSPVTEVGQAGFHPCLSAPEKSALLDRMLTAFEAHAVANGHRLLAVKDVTANDQPVWDAVLNTQSYRTIAGMPIATLPIRFQDMDAYFATLSSATRKDMRRKLKAREGLRIEERSTIDDVLPQVMALYQATRARAEMQLEELTEDYFTGVLRAMPERAFCTLYWAGDALLAFNLLLKNETTLLDKFFCMDARGRAHNLYFVSWFTNVEYCLRHGLTLYQSGAAGYENKLRLGSTLTATRMCFKHKNRLIQGALRLAAPFLAIDAPTKEAA